METLRGLFFRARRKSRAGDLALLAATFLAGLTPFARLNSAERVTPTIGSYVISLSDADPSLHVLGFTAQGAPDSASVRLARHQIFRVPPICEGPGDQSSRSAPAFVPRTQPAPPSTRPPRTTTASAPSDRTPLASSAASPSTTSPADVPRIASRWVVEAPHPGEKSEPAAQAPGRDATDFAVVLPTIEPPRRSSVEPSSDSGSPNRVPPLSVEQLGLQDSPPMEAESVASPVPASESVASPVPASQNASAPQGMRQFRLDPPIEEAGRALPVLGLGGGEVRPRVPAAVADRARQAIEEGIRLAERGALYSARARFVVALRLITQSLDAQTGGHDYSQALADGLQALEEASDFQPPGTRLEAQLNLPQIVSTHRTPVLKQEDLSAWTAMAALQRYHVYAEQQLTRAGGREMAAADALYGLARLQPFLAAEASEQAARCGPVAMSLYQAALMVEPQHYLAANELGALFARYGQWSEAREALRHAVAVRPDCPVLWENLARVHEQLGERDLAELALHERQVALRYSGQPEASSPAPLVQWVDAGTFADLSPEGREAPNVAPSTTTAQGEAIRRDGPGSVLLPSNQDKPLSVGQRHDGRRTHGR